ncbi:hypothetical protein ACR30L_05195 [Psychromonas sp. PT13]|uniref:hypothetical protein n=1 Tax=Psychromonas sp. PT13 TaxID=3439547 RepID=UPI003EBD993B
MKKVIIIAAIAAAGAGAYMISQQQQPSQTTAYNVLNYVPADTPLFTGQLEPFPIKDYLTSAPTIASPNQQKMIDDLHAKNDPKIDFFANIFSDYLQGLQNPEQFIKTFGLPEKSRGYFYTLGLLPVIKIEVENPQAIWDLLDKNEKETGFMHHEGTEQSLTYRAYSLTDESDPANLELVIAIDKGWLTITLNSALSEPSLLSTALGLTEAKASLAASGKIDEIIKKHNFNNASVSFINHIEIIKGLTTVDGNQLARQLTKLETEFNEPIFSEIRTPECATDFASIANNWPQTVAGYTDMTITKEQSTLQMSAIVESKNQVILTALQNIRGYIPNYIGNMEDSILSMGVGIDAAQLTDSLTSIWQDLQTPAYTCQPLAEIQDNIGQSGASIGMMGMGISMANGIKGAGFALLDYSLKQTENMPSIDNVDALISVTADNPLQILNSIKMFMPPELQQLQLTDNGEPVSLNTLFPIPAELNIDPKLAIKGNHLVIYSGEKSKAAADTLATEKPSQNGIYDLSVDFKKLFSSLSSEAFSKEMIPEELQFMTTYDTRIKASFDITAEGLVFGSYVNTKPSK